MSKKMKKTQIGTGFFLEMKGWGFFLFFFLLSSLLAAQEKKLPAIHIGIPEESGTQVSAPPTPSSEKPQKTLQGGSEELKAKTAPSKSQKTKPQNAEKKEKTDSGSQPAVNSGAASESGSESESDSAPDSGSVPAGESETADGQNTTYVVPVETAAFNGITPGKTSLKELHEVFGEPANVRKDGAGKGIDVEEYRVEGFKAVAFHVMAQTVYGVVAELAESTDARHLAKELGMQHIQSVFLTDEKGTIHGEIYPEIGVAFAYDPSKELGKVSDMEKNPEGIPMNVLQILFQPVGPDPFLLRAETWVDVDPKRAHADILEALELDPANQRALAYRKVLEEAVPELKNAKAPSLQAAETEKTKESKAVETETVETKTEKSSTEESETVETAKGESASTPKDSAPDEEAAGISMLTPPDLDSGLDSGLPAELTRETSEEPAGDANKPTTESAKEPEVEMASEAAQEEHSEKGTDEKEAVEKEVLAPDANAKDSASETENAQSKPQEFPETLALPETLELPGSSADSVEPSGSAELPDQIDLPLEEEGAEEGTLRQIPSLKKAEELALPAELEEEFSSLGAPTADSRADHPDAPAALSFEDDLFGKVEYLARKGHFEQAQELLEEIRKRFLENPFVAFRANLVEGDVLMIQPEPNVEQAFRCHRLAAEQGTKLLDAGKVIKGRKYPLTKAEKLIVQGFLLDAWLGTASDIASGGWDQKISNCGKWLQKVEELTQKMIQEQGESMPKEAAILRYRVAFRSLSVAVLLGKEMNVSDYANRLLAASLERLKFAENAGNYYEVCTETSMVLDDAATVCLLRGEEELASRYLNRAISMMEKIKANRKETNVNETFLLSQLYYHMGQIFALRAESESASSANGPTGQKVQKQSRTELHSEAVKWYEKSIPCLMAVIKTKQWKDLVQLARIVNGMSVSYTETGDVKRALVLLKTGIFCLEQHVTAHPEDRIQLEVPYRNMIQLLEFQGKEEEKEAYQKKLNALIL